MGDLLIGNRRFDRVGRHQVGTFGPEGFGLHLEFGNDAADGYLDLLRGGFTHADVVLLAEVILDIARKYVTGNADTVLDHDAAQRNHGDFGGAAADVDDHVALRGFHVETDSEGSSHGSKIR